MISKTPSASFRDFDGNLMRPIQNSKLRIKNSPTSCQSVPVRVCPSTIPSLCSSCLKIGSTTDKNGTTWDNVGVTMDKFGNVSDYFGHTKTAQIRIPSPISYFFPKIKIICDNLCNLWTKKAKSAFSFFEQTNPISTPQNYRKSLFLKPLTSSLKPAILSNEPKRTQFQQRIFPSCKSRPNRVKSDPKRMDSKQERRI